VSRVDYEMLADGMSLPGWDNECEGLTRTIAREYEWRVREVHNDDVEWGVEATGWDVTPPASPVAGMGIASTGPWPVPAEQLAIGGG
jgi:hypothetical protein